MMDSTNNKMILLHIIISSLLLVTIETRGDFKLDDVTVLIGDKLDYQIGDEEFLSSYKVYKIVQRGHKKLPDWLTFNMNTSMLIGHPEMKDVGKYTLKIRAQCIDPEKEDCQDKLSRTFHINVVEPLKSAESRGRKNNVLHGKNANWLYTNRHNQGNLGLNTVDTMYAKHDHVVANSYDTTSTMVSESLHDIPPTFVYSYDMHDQHVIMSLSSLLDASLYPVENYLSFTDYSSANMFITSSRSLKVSSHSPSQFITETSMQPSLNTVASHYQVSSSLLPSTTVTKYLITSSLSTENVSPNLSIPPDPPIHLNSPIPSNSSIGQDPPTISNYPVLPNSPLPTICQSGLIVYFATIIVYTPTILNFAQEKSLVSKWSEFISKDVDLITLTKSDTLHTSDGKFVLTAGPGDVIESLSNGIELTWHLHCGYFDQINDFTKILQHNIDTGRVLTEIGYNVIAWYVYTNQPLARRAKREAHNVRRQTVTPSYNPVPTTLSILTTSSSVTPIITSSRLLSTFISTLSESSIPFYTLLPTSTISYVSSSQTYSSIPSTTLLPSSSRSSLFTRTSLSEPSSMLLSSAIDVSESSSSIFAQSSQFSLLTVFPSDSYISFSTFSSTLTTTIRSSDSVSTSSVASPFLSNTFSSLSVIDTFSTVSMPVLSSTEFMSDTDSSSKSSIITSLSSLSHMFSTSISPPISSVFSTDLVSSITTSFSFALSSFTTLYSILTVSSLSFTSFPMSSSSSFKFSMGSSSQHSATVVSSLFSVSNSSFVMITSPSVSESSFSTFSLPFESTISSFSFASSIGETLLSSLSRSSFELSMFSTISLISPTSINVFSEVDSSFSDSISSFPSISLIASSTNLTDVFTITPSSITVTISLLSLSSSLVTSFPTSFSFSTRSDHILPSLTTISSFLTSTYDTRDSSLSSEISFISTLVTTPFSYSIPLTALSSSLLTDMTSSYLTNQFSFSSMSLPSSSLTTMPSSLLTYLSSNPFTSLYSSSITPAPSSQFTSLSSPFSTVLPTSMLTALPSSSLTFLPSSMLTGISSSPVTTMYSSSLTLQPRSSLSFLSSVSSFSIISNSPNHSSINSSFLTTITNTDTFPVLSYSISTLTSNLSDLSIETSFQPQISSTFSDYSSMSSHLTSVLSSTLLSSSIPFPSFTSFSFFLTTSSNSLLLESSSGIISSSFSSLPVFPTVSESIQSSSSFSTLLYSSSPFVSSSLPETSVFYSISPTLSSSISSTIMKSTIFSKRSQIQTSSIQDSLSLRVSDTSFISVSAYISPSRSLDSISSISVSNSVISISTSSPLTTTSQIMPTKSSVWSSTVTMESSIIISTVAPDRDPMLNQSIDHLEVIVGRYFHYQIPRYTFFDKEDGNTRNLTLNISLIYGRPLPVNSWLFFNATSQTLYGIPLKSDVVGDEAITKFILFATDSQNQAVKDAISITYKYDKHVNHEIGLTMNGSYSNFINDRTQLILVARNLAKFYNDNDMKQITFSSVLKGSVVVSWGNNTLFGTVCYRKYIQDMYDKLYINESLSSSLVALFGDYVLIATSLRYSGVCLLPVIPSSTVKPAPIDKSNDMWLEILLPALVAILIVVIIALLLLICCRHRRPSKDIKDSDKPAFLEDRQPIIFPEELEMVDPSLKPKTPLVLPSDYLKETPPAVPPHGRPSPPYQMPGGNDRIQYEDDAEQLEPLSHDPQQISNPPPYRLPPPYFNPHRVA